jgi:hypothetical protein
VVARFLRVKPDPDSVPPANSQDLGLRLELVVPVAFRRLASPLEEARAAASLGSNLRVFQASDLLGERQPTSRNDIDPSVLMELRRIDLKMTLMLDLLADLLAESHPPPPAAQIVLDARGMDWVDAPAGVQVGDRGVVEVFIQAGVPRPLRFVGGVVEATEPSRRRIEFDALPEAEADQLERLIFRRHRQKIAGSRGLQD